MVRISSILLLSASCAFSQGFTFKDAAWVGTVSGPTAPVIPPEPPSSGTNSNLIIITDNSTAIPYPSTNTISGYPVDSYVTNVTCGLIGFTHSYPSDVYALLQAPNGVTNSVVMFAGGNGVDAVNINLIFEDGAASDVPAPIAAGTWKPKWTALTPFAPDVASPYGTNFAAFNGVQPNGDWKLWIRDWEAGDGGYISNGWFITLTVFTNSP